MIYRTLSRPACLKVAAERLGGGVRTLEGSVKYCGSGWELDMGPLEEAAETIRELARTSPYREKDQDKVEGEAAVVLFCALDGVDQAVLEDAGFWRYLSVGILGFFEFIRWRERKTFDKGTDAHHVYLDGLRPADCVLSRMYLRVRALGGSEYEQLAGALDRSTDFWRSHILRVRTSQSPATVRALVDKQLGDRLTTKPLRRFASSLNALRSNVVLYDYDDDEAERLLAELWPDRDHR